MDDLHDLSALEYPRHVHLPSVHGQWRYRVVQTPVECAAALADGYSLTLVILPSPGADLPPQVAPLESAEPELAPPPNVIVRKGGWPKGRPRKVDA